MDEQNDTVSGSPATTSESGDSFASPTEECIAYFREEFSADPDAYTLAAIADAEANAAVILPTDEELASLRRSVWRGLPIPIPNGRVTEEGPPPTDSMVIEQGRRRRIWDGWRTHPGTIIGLLNLIEQLRGGGDAKLSSTRGTTD